MASAIIKAAAFSVLLTPAAWAQSPSIDLHPDPAKLKWTANPPIVPKGAQLAVLAGDPGKSAPFVVRLKLPANYAIPPHFHPTTEDVTVLSGSFMAGMGDKLDREKAVAFAPGGFVAMPAQMHHYAFTTQETVVQISGMGPFAVTYVNPADNPAQTH